jgi:hypothetical protein
MFGMVEFMTFSMSLAFGAITTVFWIWMLIECATKEPSGDERVIWILVIALTHLIGAAVYFFVRRPKRMAEHGA